ncbi:MAG: alpha/beta fold hydrolase [Acidisphaera sp.]|nr:alpha/beta fold hydrolase [Acidisphaera sp.]MBV9813195.1 alpha/beta fold hydrolase [Acetobacteraceae bacterium]
MILHAVEAGSGAPLVLLHGLFGRARNFGTIQKRLAARFRVLALDLRNHGDSPRAPLMTYEAMAEDVLETLRAAGALPASVLGHSMGGKVAMMAALEAPAAVSHLLVADIAPVRYRPHFAAHVAAMQAIALGPALTRAAADGALAAAEPDAGVRGFLLQNLHLGPTPEWRIGLREIGAALPAIEGWEDPAANACYRGPTTFIVGGRSLYVRPEHRPDIKRLFPTARFVTLRRAGHWLHADDPDGFVAVIEAAVTQSA